jgi:hypothetical protein
VGIDAQLEDAKGEQIQVCGDPRSHFAHFLNKRDLSATVCLRFIDPHGDTLFNRAQSAVLLDELQLLRKSANSECRPYIDNVIRLSRLASRKPHLYVRFIGD